jgi:hypothetical protein
MTSRPAKSDIVTRSVRMYPRLALTTPQLRSQSVRAMRARACRESAPGNVDRRAARTELRARLLRMIVDNERHRRNEQRPNAS